MICLAIGLGALGFLAARKARRCRRGCHRGCHHHRGWPGPGRGYGRGELRRRGLYMALSHIDASPAQERAIIAELDKIHDRLHAARVTLKDGRGDLAAAIRGPALDDAALASVLGRVDAATGEARTAVLEALRNIHGLLDDGQRNQLADVLDGGFWRRGGGPYRV